MEMERLIEQIVKEVCDKISNKQTSSTNFSYGSSEKVTAHDIAKMIDHSLLKPEMTRQEVIDGCKLAVKYDCATVCVKPCDVEVAGEVVKDTDVLLSTVIGFPHGHHLTEVKVMEAEIAMSQGCVELDLVMNIGRFKSGEYDYVEKDIRTVCEAAHRRGAIVKVILENHYLTDSEVGKASAICDRAGADFVKTSTGYAKSGATIKDLKIMKNTVSPRVRVKAAGGVRTLDGALSVRAVGGVRFGATATQKIMDEAYQREKQGTLKLPLVAQELSSGY